MTSPKEWANIFHNCLRSNCSEHDTYEDCENELATHFHKAVEEARQDGTFRGGYHLGDLQKAYRRGRAEGEDNLSYWQDRLKDARAEAFEQAAKVAERGIESWPCEGTEYSLASKDIAKQIRSLKGKP